MKVKEILPRLKNRVQFTLRFWKGIPKEPGCYLLATFDDEVLYIGLTNDLHRRFSEHRDSKEKRYPTVKGRAFWFYYLICDEKELRRIERTWHNQYVELHAVLPVLNKINSPVG